MSTGSTFFSGKMQNPMVRNKMSDDHEYAQTTESWKWMQETEDTAGGGNCRTVENRSPGLQVHGTGRR